VRKQVGNKQKSEFRNMSQPCLLHCCSDTCHCACCLCMFTCTRGLGASVARRHIVQQANTTVREGEGGNKYMGLLDVSEEFLVAVAVERRSAHQQDVQHDAQAPHIARGGVVRASHDLRPKWFIQQQYIHTQHKFIIHVSGVSTLQCALTPSRRRNYLARNQTKIEASSQTNDGRGDSHSRGLAGKQTNKQTHTTKPTSGAM
jgi:hypothetical protein